MIERGYDKKFTLGLLAAGGTLGILIPPSIPMILYGAITEESVGKLFIAGIVPGFLLTVIFVIYAIIREQEGRIYPNGENRLVGKVKDNPKEYLGILLRY